MKTLGSLAFVLVVTVVSRDPGVFAAAGAALLIIVSGGFARRTQF
ncbi:MAG: hypothetical protein ABI120_08875 [Gemmatimonadaceae bacterium]